MLINHSNNTKQKLQVREWVNEWVRVVVVVAVFTAAGVVNVCVCVECLCVLRLNVLRSARCQMWSKQNNKNTHSMFACVCTHEYICIYICMYICMYVHCKVLFKAWNFASFCRIVVFFTLSLLRELKHLTADCINSCWTIGGKARQM